MNVDFPAKFAPAFTPNRSVIYEPPTLRDQFAMAALTALIAFDPLWHKVVIDEVPDLAVGPSDDAEIAKNAYQMADAMIEARKVRP